MKHCRKFTALFTALVIALTLTACGVSSSDRTYATASVKALADKYENDFIKDMKNSDNALKDKSVTSTGWNPDGVISDSIVKGGNAILSSASLDGMEVSLIAHDITHLSEREVDGEYHTKNCDGNLCADKILLYLKDSSGRKILSTQINGNVGHHSISEACLFDGGTRIYKTEQDGETYYLLMQYADFDKEKNALIASFYVLDMELYEYGCGSVDENGVLCGALWFVNIGDPEEKRIGGWAQGYQASKDFEYKEGTTFFDPEYGYEITFDMKKGKAKVTYPSL